MATKRPPSSNPASAWDRLLAALLDTAPPARQRQQAVQFIQQALDTRHEAAAELLLDWLSGTARELPSGRAPPAWLEALLRLLRRALLQHGATERQLERLADVLAKRDPVSLRPLLGPALRVVIGKPRHDDRSVLDAWLNQFLKEISMALTFFVDTSSIPILQDDVTLQRLIEIVESELQNTFGLPPGQADVESQPGAAVILGMTVLDGEVDPASSGLPDALRRAWLESLGKIDNIPSANFPGPQVPNSVVYKFIADNLPSLNGGLTKEAVQEFAFVAREVIAGAPTIPFGHPNFLSAIRIALDKYVQTRSAGDTLSLPPASLPGGTQNAGGDADLNSDNIRVTGLVYGLALLEKTLVFRVTDRVTELFMNGLLPFGHDAAGKALDDYYWDAEDRLTESQRRSQYSRMLGMPGGEVSREVAPNKDFEQLFLRLIASVSEFTRQREVDRMFNNRSTQLSMTAEQVRTSFLALGSNASLRGYGAFFTATRINQHLQRAIGILNQPQVLKAYSATNHWQVIERVSQQDFGGAPNWAKYSTMAQAASTLFTIIANNTAVLSSNGSGRPFLFDPTLGEAGQGDLDRETTNRVLSSVQQWLAVNGVRDDQIHQYAQPVELTTAPSLPGGMPGSSSGNAMDVINQIKQLTASGAPNPDQLQQLLAKLN